jgi:hypothetical protein
MEPVTQSLVRVDASGYVDQKIAAVAAHRTQYPITPDLLPRPMLQELFGQEYFVRVHPLQERQTSIRLGSGPSRRAMRALSRATPRQPAALA